MSKKLKNVTGSEKKNIVKRPRDAKGLIFTDEMLEDLARVAPYLTWQHIADYFKINQETLYKILARDPRVAEVYKKAKAEKIYMFGNKLREKAMGEAPEADTAALIFYLKVHGRWKDNIEQPDVNININTLTDNQRRQKEIDIKLYDKYRRDMGFGMDSETAIDAEFVVEETKLLKDDET